MAEARFDLVILHHASEKSVENLVQELLQLLGKAGDPYLEYKLSEALLFEQSSSAILDNIERTEGERYQQKFRQLKVETELRPTLQLVAKEQAASGEEVEQYICPACKHTQPKQTGAEAMNTCNRCGVVGEKLARSERKKEIFSTEKRKLEQNENKEMKAAAIRARTEDEAAMRKEAQEKLGLRSKKNTAGIGVAIGGVVIIGVTSFFIIDALINNSEEIMITKTAEVTDDPDAKKQPLISIDAGNGSIVINNDQASNVENAGNSGSKGSIGEGTENGADVAENQLAGGASVATDQSGMAIQNATGTDGVASEASQQLAANGDAVISGSQPTLQDPLQAGAITAANSTSLENQPLAVAAVSQATQETMNGSSVKQAAAKVKVAKASSSLSKMNTAVTPSTELSTLAAILSATHSPEYFFDKLNKKQFEEHQGRLQRLLTLGKPALALVFAESMEDPYPTSLMVLAIAQHEAENNNTKLFSDLLLSMKSLATKGDSIQQNALLNVSLSQAYAFAGEQDSAQALLEKSMTLLEDPKVSLAERCQLLAQIEQKQREFGSKGGADLVAEKIVDFAATLSDKDYTYASRAYTHLAAASLTDNKQDEARGWLNQIPVQDAREYLLAQVVAISAAASKMASQ